MTSVQEKTRLENMGNVKNRDDEEFVSMVETLSGYGKTWKERMTNFLVESGVSLCQIERIRKILLEEA